jgi:CRP-like cAMP-binding protein
MLSNFSGQNRSRRAKVQLSRQEQARSREVALRTARFDEATPPEFESGSSAQEYRNRSMAWQTEVALPGGRQVPPTLKTSPCRDPFIAKLSLQMGLPEADQQAILAAALPPRCIGKQESILEDGEQPRSLLFLCSGSARAYRSFEDGSQQIVSVLLPGDLLNPGDLVLRRSQISVCAITPSVVIEIPLADLLSLMASRPRIMRALWIENAMQAAIQRERMIWLGRRNALSRLAHFLCELTYRLQIGGRGEFSQFPLTQQDLADTLGLSTVHVNRVLKLLRNRRLIDIRRNHLNVLDKEGLYALAGFDPGYLTSPGPIWPEDAMNVSVSSQACLAPS